MRLPDDPHAPINGHSQRRPRQRLSANALLVEVALTGPYDLPLLNLSSEPRRHAARR
jgi:hypothetical protein